MAVYTPVPDDALRAFLAGYDIGELVACDGIAEGVENTNYRLRTTRADFILTLYEQRVDVAELPYFLGLMEHLSTRGVVCPRPVAGRDGSVLRTLCGRAAAVTTFLPGQWPRSVEMAHCAPVGDALARLHVAGEGYAGCRANALGPRGWSALLARSRTHAKAASLPAGLFDELEAALSQLSRDWPLPGLPTGHIHADLFPDNVFFRGGEISGLIDFYFAAVDILAYDVAVCLNAWCFTPELAWDRARAAALLSGYEALRRLQPKERAALPTLCAGAAIRFTLTRLYDWLATPADALVTRKDPRDYLARLRLFRDRPDLLDGL